MVARREVTKPSHATRRLRTCGGNTEVVHFGRKWAKQVSLLVAAASGLAACGPTYTYLTSQSSESYLAVPHAWKVYDQSAIDNAAGGSSGVVKMSYLSIFDANPHPSVKKDPLHPTAKPWGVIQIRQLAANEIPDYSFDSLENEIVQFSELQSDNEASVVGEAKEVTHGNYRGVTQEIEIREGEQLVLADESGYINTSTTKSWALLVGCSESCFNTNHAEITRLVHSWTVGKS
jgi:hypothetical protein